jgi:stage II sporulation protein D
VEPAQADPVYFARWNINYGEYLIDVGKYLEAMEAFQTAIEATTNPQIRAEAYLHRASTLALFLDAYDEARREYERILQEQPQTGQAETARYRLALLLFEQQQYEDAIAQLESYLRQYPQGRFARSAELLLSKSRQAREAPTPPLPSLDLLTFKRPQVRVRLLPATQHLDIRSSGQLTVATIAGQQVFQGEGQVTMQPDAGRIIVGKQAIQATELRITAKAPLHIKQKEVQCSRRESRSPAAYQGALRIVLHNGKLQVINEVDIEEYLYGVVPAEVPASWPPEALKTQAIAARTYALYQVKHRTNWRYDLVDSEGDQVYKGLQCAAEQTNQAVDVTQGMILIHKQFPILAMYTSNTGWHSASATEYLLNKALPYLIGVPDAYSPTQPMGQWTRTYEAKNIQRQLAKIRLPVAAIQDIIPQEITPSGRIKKVKLIHRNGTQVLPARPTLMRALQLPEVLVQITRDQHTYVFEGGGFGHGVGLSQWGAKAMADEGKSARDILQFYYRNVDVQKVW